MITPPRHGACRVEVQRIDCCIRGIARSLVVPDDVIPRFVRLYQEAVVEDNVLLEPEIGLSHGSTKDGTEVAELNTRQVLDDPEEVGTALN